MILLEKCSSSSFLVLILFILLIYWLWSRRHFYALSLYFPGRLGLPIIGILHKIKNVDYVLSSIGEFFEECNANTIFLWIGLYPMMITQDPIVAEKVLNSSKLLTKATPLYDAMNDAFQGGILTSPVSEWRIHRKMINPVFNQKVLLSFFPIFNKAKNNMNKIFENILKTEKNSEVNVSEIIQKTMLKVASETVMGRRKEIEEKDFKNFMTAYFLIFKRVAILSIHSLLNIYRIMKFDRTYTNLLEKFHNFVKGQLHERLHKESQPHYISEDDEKSEDKPPIFIDIIFEQWKEGKLSWQNVISESNTMMIASIETTSNALFSAIIMLAMHPSIQKRLYEELITVFNDNEFEVQYEDLAKLPYLEMVVQETLRLAPSVPLIGRQITEPTEIDGVIVPKGVQLLISIFHIHRNKNIWGPNANKFDPENFLPSNQAKRHSHGYIPFSKGLRNCVGWRYAMFALKIMLIGLAYNYEFDTNFKLEDLEFVDYMTLAYIREPPIKITARKGRS